MDNIFDNLFTITNKNKEGSKIAQLEIEIQRLQLCYLRMSQEANQKRKDAMQIMMQRLEQQDTLNG